MKERRKEDQRVKWMIFIIFILLFITFLFVCAFLFLLFCFNLSSFLSPYLCVCLSVCVPVCLSICLSISASVCVSVCLSLCLFVYSLFEMVLATLHFSTFLLYLHLFPLLYNLFCNSGHNSFRKRRRKEKN